MFKQFKFGFSMNHCCLRACFKFHAGVCRAVVGRFPFSSSCQRSNQVQTQRPNFSNVRCGLWFSYGGLLGFLGLDRKEETKVTAEQIIINYIKAAIIAQQGGHLDVAERLLHLALRLAQEQQHRDATTYVYDTMANLALERGEPEKAEHLFKSVMQRLVLDGFSESDNAMLEISIKLADMYSQSGRDAEAEAGYSFCLKHLGLKLNTEESQSDDILLLWAMCTDSYGRHLLNRKRVSQARTHFLKALETCETVLGPTHSQTLVVLNNLGAASSMAGNYDEAARHLKRAVDIARDTGSDNLAAYYRNLGMVYLQMNRVVEAKHYCKRSLAVSTQEGALRNEDLDCLNVIKQSKNL